MIYDIYAWFSHSWNKLNFRLVCYLLSKKCSQSCNLESVKIDENRDIHLGESDEFHNFENWNSKSPYQRWLFNVNKKYCINFGVTDQLGKLSNSEDLCKSEQTVHIQWEFCQQNACNLNMIFFEIELKKLVHGFRAYLTSKKLYAVCKYSSRWNIFTSFRNLLYKWVRS